MKVTLRSLFLLVVVASVTAAASARLGLGSATAVAVIGVACGWVAVWLTRRRPYALLIAGVCAIGPALLVPLYSLAASMLISKRLGYLYLPSELFGESSLVMALSIFAVQCGWLGGIDQATRADANLFTGEPSPRALLQFGAGILGTALAISMVIASVHLYVRHMARPAVDLGMIHVLLIGGALLGVPYLIAWLLVRSRRRPTG